MIGFNFARLKAGSKAVDLRAIDRTQLEAALRKGSAESLKSILVGRYRYLPATG
jgi:hypothetical protein